MLVSIFTRWKNEKLINLIEELRLQTIKPKIRVFSDSFFDFPGIEIVYTQWKNISEKRNLAIDMAKEEDLLFLLDDDNKLGDNKFLEKMKNTYLEIFDKYGCCVISPLINWRTTDRIQSAGVYFSYFLGKVIVNRKVLWSYWDVRGIWWNSLFWYGRCFKKSKFDENIWYVREDLDYSYSLNEKWVKVFVINQKIFHLERDKTRLEQSFLLWEAFNKKVRNRDIFVKKHGNFIQKIIYWLFWRWISLFYWKYLKIKFRK